MNYNQFVRDWWTQAQKQGSILTKPVIKRKLEKQVQELQSQIQILTAQLDKKSDKKSHYKQELNLILNNWKFDGQTPQSAQEFLNKFTAWIKATTQKVQELKKARAQELIDKLQKDLGINFLLDYQNIIDKLKGRTVEEVLGEEKQKDQTIKKLEVDQINLSTNLKKQIQALTILANKRKEDLEREKQALIALAKQKIANKKEASELLKQLENKWQQDKEEWEEEKEELMNQHQQELEQAQQTSKEYETKLVHQEQNFTNNRKLWQDNLKEKDQQITNKEQELIKSKDNQSNLLASIQDLTSQNKELITKNKQIEQELAEKNNWGDNNLPQLKEELFNSFKATYQALKNQIKKTTIAWGRKEIEEKIKELDDYFSGDFTSAPLSEPSQLENKHQEQLRQINLLFDPSATNYEVIDFNGLYELLKNVAERERERERR